VNEPLMEWRVNLQWKLTEDDDASIFRDRSKSMDKIAEKYNEFMTDGGSGFGFGQRDMDWTFNSNAMAIECMQAMMVDLCRELGVTLQDHDTTFGFDDTLEWLKKHNIEIYITEINPEDYD
tara:strand:- start:1523 stop:1885 length:363 start_codon:yes stop_codon:yes gene_type:complete